MVTGLALLALLSSPVWAQRVPPESGGDDANYEVIVFGEILVRQARDEVERTLAQEGFTTVIERDGRTIYRHEDAWAGDVVLYDDGWMVMKRQPARFEAREMPWAEKGSPLAVMGCVVYPFLCFRPNGQLVSRRRFMGTETETVQAVHDEVETWADRIADLAVGRKVDGLPDRMELLWDHGIPLDGDVRLASFEARRVALFAYWDSRTDTPWGEEVRAAVEAFCRGVVQRSEHPFTDAEIASFNKFRVAFRAFDLSARASEPSR